MKIKNDFVTNSSSASFILTLKPAEKMDFAEFSTKFGEFIQKMIEWNPREFENMRFWDGSHIIQTAPDKFELIDWTSMYNDLYDIPRYMRHILLLKAIDEEPEWFTVDKFIVIAD